MAVSTLGGVPLPRITQRRGGRQLIGSRERAVDGTLHVDYVTDKRTWSIDCSYLTLQQFKALEEVYNQAMGGAVLLTLPDLDQVAYVVITDFPDDIAQWARPDGTWEQYGRSVQITLEEV